MIANNANQFYCKNAEGEFVALDMDTIREGQTHFGWICFVEGIMHARDQVSAFIWGNTAASAVNQKAFKDRCLPHVSGEENNGG